MSQKLVNDLYKMTESLTKGLFHDTDWSHIHAVTRKVEEKYKVYTSVKNGGYFNEGKSKRWELYIYDPSLGHVAAGNICACAAGTVEDPWLRYDICLILYRLPRVLPGCKTCLFYKTDCSSNEASYPAGCDGWQIKPNDPLKAW